MDDDAWRSNGTTAPTGHSPVDVPVGELHLGMSARTEPEDESHVQVLAETIDHLPPILVHRATMTIIDGAHHFLAALRVNRPTISVRFFDGDDDAAYVEAVRHNIAHGRPLTIGEREGAAARIIASHPDWSDRRIAAVCGLSAKTVARSRARATAAPPQSSGRVGQDGRRRPSDPGSSRADIALFLRRHPEASVRSVARLTGSSQATVRDVRARLSQGTSPLTPRQRWAPDGHGGHGGPAGHGGNVGPETPDPHDDVRWVEDSALRATPQGKAFAEWFTAAAVSEDHWASYTEAVPLSRVYLVVAEARRRARTWEGLAAALEARARSVSR